MKSILHTVLLSTLVSACTKSLLVDDYTNLGTTGGINAVGGCSSDDGSCTTATGSDSFLSLIAGSSKCYYYTNFPDSKPEDAVGGHRSNLHFTVVPPTPNWSFKINAKSWNGTKLADSYVNVAGTALGSQIVSIPLVNFNGPDVPNLRNIKSFVFESFSDVKGTWTVGKLSLLCAK